jgi:predicted DCC family thiol-disulfide oxidoreductase YuxK
MSSRNAPDDGGHPVVLFDGVCNLCESTVRFIIARDRRSQFRFASLQSGVARELAAPFDYAHDELSSVLLIEDGRIYSKARAGLRIARRLDGAWPLFYYLFFWVPGFVANPVYDFVGKRRYRWFGRKEACWVPTDDLRARFLDFPSSGD